MTVMPGSREGRNTATKNTIRIEAKLKKGGEGLFRYSGHLKADHLPPLSKKPVNCMLSRNSERTGRRKKK